MVSVSFEEDEEGNLCLIAYPLHSDGGDVENHDPASDCEPKSKMLKWSNKMQSALLLEKDNYGKERSRHGRKDDKIIRLGEWAELAEALILSDGQTNPPPPPPPVCSYNRDEMQQHQQAEVLYLSLEKSNRVPQFKHNPWSLKCHQQHLQRMKENAKHRNQYSILPAAGASSRAHAALCLRLGLHSGFASLVVRIRRAVRHNVL